VRTRRPVALLAAAAATVALLSACSSAASSSTASSSATSSASSTASPSPSSSNPYGVLTVDPPGPTEAILTITGGTAGPVALTLAQLEALGLETVTIDEPFVKQKLTFRGVSMEKVLAKAGIPAGANITTKALNDYEYANLASAFTGSHAFIATRRGDEPVPFDAGGPIRIIFPDGSALASTLDAWNWSIASIRLTNGS
jgi:hypothetical protein